MKKTVSALSFLLIPAAFAMSVPEAVLERIENDIVPRIQSSSEFKLTKISRINSSGRQVPKGTCIFSNDEVSLSVEYCDMANPQAQKLELTDSVVGESYSTYLERNSSTNLPHFKFANKDSSGSCFFTSFIGTPICHDNYWSNDVLQYKSFNAVSESTPRNISFLKDFASRIEAVDKILRVIARSRP